MTRLSELAKEHPLKVFFLVTFSLSWVLWYFGGRYSPVFMESGVSGYRFLLNQIGEYAPAFAGLGVLALVKAMTSARRWRTMLAVFVPAFVLAAVMSFSTEDVVLRDTTVIIAAAVVTALVVVVLSPANRRSVTVYSLESRERPGTAWLVLSVLLLPVIVLVAKTLAQHLEGNGLSVLPARSTWGEMARHAVGVFSITRCMVALSGRSWGGEGSPCRPCRRSTALSGLVPSLASSGRCGTPQWTSLTGLECLVSGELRFVSYSRCS